MGRARPDAGLTKKSTGPTRIPPTAAGKGPRTRKESIQGPSHAPEHGWWSATGPRQPASNQIRPEVTPQTETELLSTPEAPNVEPATPGKSAEGDALAGHLPHGWVLRGRPADVDGIRMVELTLVRPGEPDVVECASTFRDPKSLISTRITDEP
jgi:hypothetical protein